MIMGTLSTRIVGGRTKIEQVEIIKRMGNTFVIVRPFGTNAVFPVRAWRVTGIKTTKIK